MSRFNSLKDEVHVLVAEKGWHDDGGADDGEDAAHEHQDALGDVALVIGHFYINLQGSDDGHYTGHGIYNVDRIYHHRADKRGGLGQSVRAPRVVDGSASGIYVLHAEHGCQEAE